MILAAFCVCYVVTVPASWQRDDRRYWALIALHRRARSSPSCPSRTPTRSSWGCSSRLVAVIKFGGRALPVAVGFTLHWRSSSRRGPLLARHAHDRLLQRHGDRHPPRRAGDVRFRPGDPRQPCSAEARVELASLAAENERTRIASDLHDLLGHSLTTITVKAELADQLARHDADARCREIGEVAALSRRALERRARRGLELPRGHPRRRARDRPGAAARRRDRGRAPAGGRRRRRRDPGALRLGVARGAHQRRPPLAGADLSRCHISPSSVEIVDDGVGAMDELRQRAHRACRRVAVGRRGHRGRPAQPSGWRLAVHARTDAPRDDPAPHRRRPGAHPHRARRLLDLEEDFSVVASVGRGDEVAAAARRPHPDVALLDIEMPGIDGLAAAAILTEQVPSCRSLIVTTFGRPGYLRRAMESGAAGFVVKDTPVDSSPPRSGGSPPGSGSSTPPSPRRRSRTAPRRSPHENATCSPRRGSSATVAEIAERLFLSEGTVRNYLSSAIAKAGARNRTEAARVAEEYGWL